MAITFAKATLSALEVLFKRTLADAVSPLDEKLSTLLERPTGVVVVPQPEPEPQPEPQPEPEPQPQPGAVSGCVVDIVGADGKAWRWDATAAAKQDSLGLRAMAEVPAEIAGVTSLRLVVDLGPGWAVVAPRNDIAMREGAGEAKYSIKVTLDGREVLNERYLVQTFATGEVYVLGQEPFWPLPSTSDLISRKMIAPYKQGSLDGEKAAQWAATMASAEWSARDSSRGVSQYMPGTGGREDIGPTTAVQAAYLVTRSQVSLDYMIGQADTAPRIPWHLWDAGNGRWLSVENYPMVWTDGRGGTGTPGDRNASGLTVQLPETAWTPESAHQPDLCWVPWLLTGRRYYLDELQAQAAWNVVNTWTNERGPDGTLVIVGSQVRHSAWALRQIDEAADASPEGSPERAYFRRLSDANWGWIRSQLPAWKIKQGEAFGRMEGSYGTEGATPPWQQDYFASTAAAAARRGNVDAKAVLLWMANFLIGRFEHLGHDGCAYLLMTENEKTWAGIKARTEAVDWSNGDGWAHSDGDYAQLARFSLLCLAEFGVKDAVKWADWLVTEGAPYVSEQDYLREPTLRIAAPTA